MSECAKAFCHNPIAPLVLLEMPDFAARLDSNSRFYLLREENIPLLLVKQILTLADARSGGEWAAHEARQHITVAGEIQSQDEWELQIEIFWRAFYALAVDLYRQRNEKRCAVILNRYHDLAEVGLAPEWVAQPPYDVEAYEVPAVWGQTPDATEWLQFAVSPNSDQEQELWARVAPRFARRPEIAAWARFDASETTLARLAALDHEKGCLQEVIASHPKTTPLVMQRLVRPRMAFPTHYWHESGGRKSRIGCGFPAQYRLVIRYDTPTEVLAKLAQSDYSQIRLLARRHKNTPTNARELSRQAALQGMAILPTTVDTPELYLERFNAAIRGVLPLWQLVSYSSDWMAYGRLAAAFALPAKPIPVPNEKRYEYTIRNGCETTTRDLLEHLARDGNRLVRWAAQTRLNDPDYKFTWR